MSETISIEHVKRATDKRGGYLVHLCRTKVTGRMGASRWVDVRILNGKFEKWNSRWSKDLEAKVLTQVLSFIELKAAELAKEDDRGRPVEVHYRPPARNARDLLRDIEAE
jgi:hypothetical protein